MSDTWGGLDPATFHAMTDSQRAMRRALWHHIEEQTP